MNAKEFRFGMSWNAFRELCSPCSCLCAVMVCVLACLFASFWVSWSMQQVHFRSTQVNTLLIRIHAVKSRKKIQWKLYWGNSSNDRMECGIKLFAIAESLLLYRSLCAMLKCSLAQKATLVTIKIEITETIARSNLKNLREGSANVKFCTMCCRYVLNEIKHLIANHQS